MQTDSIFLRPAEPLLRATTATERCLSLDALRGFVMLALCWGAVLDAESLALHPGFRGFALQFRHVPWEGLRFWELVQPLFWFVVGAALPLALARRRERGATFRQNLGHASARALRLILLGQILVSLQAGRLRFQPVETLTHLGLIYFFCFLVMHLRFRWQVVVAAMLMAVNWGLYVWFPGSAGPFSPADNIGVRIDRAVFGLNQAGSYTMLNMVGSAVNMLFGVWAGSLLRSQRPQEQKLKILAAAALASFAVALALTPVNPVIQRVWTASITFYGAACTFLALLLFFWLFDVKAYRALAFPLVVVGMNSIFIYMLNGTLRRWLDPSVAVFTGRFEFMGPFGSIAQASAVVATMWYVCYWLYQRKVFFKV